MYNKKEDKKNKNADGDLKYDISTKIQDIRKARGLLVKTVADKLSISRSALTQIETGRNNVSAVILWKLSCLFGCSVNDFFPNTPEGFNLTKTEIQKIKEDDQKAVEFALKCFPKQKKDI